MATLSFTMGAMTTSKTISASDTTRVLNALKTFYLRGLPGTPDLTTQQIFDLWVASEIQRLKDVVISEEGVVAAATAVGAIVTPAIT